MTVQSTRSGRCLCGKVTYTFVPAELEIDACHCGMCRRWGGGPGLSVKAAGEADVSGRDYVSLYKSSEWGMRHFCRECGSHLFYSAPSAGYFGVSAGTIDDLDGLAFTTEIYVDCKPDAYAFANPTRKLTEAEFLAMIASSGHE
jgi:hypothetical protein